MSIDSTSTKARLLIVDGHSYAYRAFFAIRKLSSPSGRPTNAIYGFIRMLGKTRATIAPSHSVVVWDGGLAEERTALLPGYKAQRAEMPAELGEQIDQIVDYLVAAGVTSWMREGVEADDCIGALARQAEEAGMEVVIASSDKDFMQLVSPNVRVLPPSVEIGEIIDVQRVIAKTGVEPSQIVDWLSLVGDAVDNIPGVTGVGPKTATVLLQKHGSIEEIYRHLPEITPNRLRSGLENSAELVKKNQKLLQLQLDVRCGLQLAELQTRQPDTEKLSRLFEGWGFRTLLRELSERMTETGELFDRKAGHNAR